MQTYAVKVPTTRGPIECGHSHQTLSGILRCAHKFGIPTLKIVLVARS